MYRNIKYFNGLSALRFFAAYMVVIHHAEQIRLKYHLFSLKQFSLFNNGGVGVTFFFVLSGFLITYLLLKENDAHKTISIRNFYVRRVLRIWPLYFMLVGIGTVALPFIIGLLKVPYQMPYTFTQVIGYYVFFAPFLVNVLFGHHLLEPLWSIGVEELFYLSWAPAIKVFKKYILQVIIVTITVKVLLSILAVLGVFPNSVREVLGYLQFESMGIGGLGAFLLFHRKTDVSQSKLFSKTVQILIFIFILGYIFFWKELTSVSVIFSILWSTPVFTHILLSVLFCWLIVNIAVNERSIIKLRSKILHFLGEISYGIYMYHMLVVFGVVVVFSKLLNGLHPLMSTILFYVVITSGTVLVSYLSKRFFENWFLEKKHRFEK